MEYITYYYNLVNYYFKNVFDYIYNSKNIIDDNCFDDYIEYDQELLLINNNNNNNNNIYSDDSDSDINDLNDLNIDIEKMIKND